jgi:hypothetical protein
MTSNHCFHLQHFDKWWQDSSAAHLNFSAIPSYHLGQFIPHTRTYELLQNHELIVMVPAHYKNGLRFLNHIIICLQELLQHLGPSHCWNILQPKYEAFEKELLVLSKIREDFIQEARMTYDQPGMHNIQWMSSILNSFLAYMYHCGSINPHYKSFMMDISLDDPQTYSNLEQMEQKNSSYLIRLA